MIRSFCTTIFCLLTFLSIAQLSDEDRKAMHTLEDTLGVLGYVFVNDSLAENRFAAVQKFIPTLVTALKHPHSFDYSFERIPTVAVIYPPDSSFRIFTWQLYVDTDEYRHFGAIQMNSPELNLIPLLDKSADIALPEMDVLGSENWYGALYYNIRQFETVQGRRYLLFGLDSHAFFSRQKILDVLYFDEGKAKFGEQVFQAPDKPQLEQQHRMILRYSAAASVKLNYDDQLGMIIFDHLITQSSPDGELVSVPDGSYQGFKLDQGKWTLVDKVFDHVYDEAPRPQPVLDERPKNDIFGKEVKGEN